MVPIWELCGRIHFFFCLFVCFKNSFLSTFKSLTKFSTWKCRTKVPISFLLPARDCPVSFRICLHFLACGPLYLLSQICNAHSSLSHLGSNLSYFLFSWLPVRNLFSDAPLVLAYWNNICNMLSKGKKNNAWCHLLPVCAELFFIFGWLNTGTAVSIECFCFLSFYIRKCCCSYTSVVSLLSLLELWLRIFF